MQEYFRGQDRKKHVPRNFIEESLLEIWQNILNTEEIGIHDDFFKLGGNSFQMACIITRIRGVFSIDLPLQIFFENPTISSLA